MDHSGHENHYMHGDAVTEVDHSLMDHSAMNHSDSMDHSNHQTMDHMMMMYFHFSASSTILFKGWKTTDWQGMLGSCVAVFVMAALYEGLKVFREHLLRRSQANVTYTTAPTTENGPVQEVQSRTARTRMLSLAHLVQTLLHVLQIVVSYFLMLIFMTYNGWLCIAVALGAGMGYFLFAWKRAIVIDVNEHCH